MHELSIAQSIVEAVKAHATTCNATHVKGVRLRIGEAAGVVTDSLTFCFEMIASTEPMLEGATLLIDTVPHRARCQHCNQEFRVKQCIAQCPLCGEWSEEIVSGHELQILDMEIDVEPVKSDAIVDRA